MSGIPTEFTISLRFACSLPCRMAGAHSVGSGRHISAPYLKSFRTSWRLLLAMELMTVGARPERAALRLAVPRQL